MRRARALVVALLLVSVPTAAQTIDVPDRLGPEPARAARDRALEWLVTHQNEDGSWATGALDGLLEMGFSVESFYCWKYAASALAAMALLHAPETPERRAALEHGLTWLSTTRVPQRGSDWDVDFLWAGLYGFVAATEAAADPRFQDGEWPERLGTIGRRAFGVLEANQVPTGGWGYYDDPIYSRRPKWATSFSTAVVLPALASGEQLGWVGDAQVRERATRFVSRCALPNGAYAYDLRPIPWIGGDSINGVKGSLCRIQVANWALASVGEKKITAERLRAGLESFLDDHRFLDVAWMRPVPHEAYYYNSGYFYLFGHYYAARVIGLLPAEEREGWHARLRPHLVKVQRADGSTSDFLTSAYMMVSGTAFLALALELGLPPEPVIEAGPR
jgi:hypothetical protein